MHKKTVSAIAAAMSICLLSACATEYTVLAPADTSETEQVTQAEAGLLQVAAPGENEGAGGELAAVTTIAAEPAADQEAQAPQTEDTAAETTEEPAAETTEATTEAETKSPNIGLTALAVVPNYVNVRKSPSTEAEVVGKIFNNCAAYIIDEMQEADGSWFLISSGNVIGYIKSEFFLVGDEAEAMKEEVGVLTGIVKEEYLRVRSEPDLTNPDNVFTYYEEGTKVYIEELTDDGWAKMKSDDASSGFVYAECLDIRMEFQTAMTLQEEEAEIRRREEAEEAARIAQEELEATLKAQEEAERLAAEAAQAQAAAEAAALAAQQAAEADRAAAEAAAAQAAQAAAAQAAAAQAAADQAAAATDPASATRNAVVAFALQWVGHPYVHGGRSLDTGTDCSGFTHLVYQNFGVDWLDWTPRGQSVQGTRVDVGSIQPGDLLFYANSYSDLGHVAMYIGNGQIVHSGTVETGVIVSSAYYRNPVCAVRIIN